MVVPKRVCLPCILNDKPMSGQRKEGQGDTGVDSSSVASTAMVPDNSRDGGDHPNSSELLVPNNEQVQHEKDTEEINNYKGKEQ